MKMESRIYALLAGTRRDHSVITILVDHETFRDDPEVDHYFVPGTTEMRQVGLVTMEGPCTVMADLGGTYEEA